MNIPMGRSGLNEDYNSGERAMRPLSHFDGTLANRVYLTLKQAIMSLDYQPGDILKKAYICSALGVSRSPVSEAIARLSAEGLVDVVPQAGTFVSRFSWREIREGAFLREALELAAVEMVARGVTEPQLVLLRRNLRVQQALIDDNDFAGFYQMDTAMHELIMGFTGHQRLAHLAETSWLQVNRARQLILPTPGRVQATLEEHRGIVDAIALRDVAKARAATKYHLGQLITLLKPLERDHPELFQPSQ